MKTSWNISSDYKGAGVECTLNLAAILAHRLKRDTKLNGLAGGLGAYFGMKSETTKELEPPISGDAAEFELAPAIMASFVRETLRLPPGTEVYLAN